jgi:hypothetical protein
MLHWRMHGCWVGLQGPYAHRRNPLGQLAHGPASILAALPDVVVDHAQAAPPQLHHAGAHPRALSATASAAQQAAVDLLH